MTTIPNPKDSMKSTWRTDRSQWGFYHWLLEILSVHPNSFDVDTPKHSKDDSVPYLSAWEMHRWVLFHACIPLILHQAYVYWTGKNFSPLAAFIFYTVAFNAIAIHQLQSLRHLGHIYGFFDGDKHERDQIPDMSVPKVVRSLLSTSTFRPLMTIMLAYRRSQTPANMNWYWLPIEVGLYGVILDFWFYWYHRIMHESDTLWKWHRTHHLTKHPNPLLTLFADGEQEFFDIAGIPFLAWGVMKLVGFPMGFYEWWICHQYVVFSELAGHSGLRVLASPPSTVDWLLSYWDVNLVVEDHDIHHRHGWKKSGNYGKQTRLWDYVFGTCRERIECTPKNIDYNTKVNMPLFSWPTPPPS